MAVSDIYYSNRIIHITFLFKHFDKLYEYALIVSHILPVLTECVQ